MNIRGLRSNSVNCESSLDVLAMCETNLDDSIDSGYFSVRGYLSLTRKDSSTHKHCLAASFCTGLISRKRDLRFRLVLLQSMSYFFFLYRSSSSSLCTVFDYISPNIDEVLVANPSANVFAFGDFNDHHKDRLTCSGGTDRSGKPCYNFSFSDDLTQVVNFATRIPRL